ncbi:MAG: hypothetical protein ROO71_12720 [Balneola sp.]
MEYIRPNSTPDKLAVEAYENEHYIEAIQLLHSWLENQAQELLKLVGSGYFNAKLKETWDVTDTLSFNNCIKVLFILNQISRSEYDEFREFNSLRNKIIHQIYKEPYEKEFLGIPKQHYDKVYEKTLEQVYFFSNKSGEVMMKDNPK